MTETPQLTEDQKKRIATTLRRIRNGLKRLNTVPFEEPAHVFRPEVADEKN